MQILKNMEVFELIIKEITLLSQEECHKASNFNCPIMWENEWWLRPSEEAKNKSVCFEYRGRTRVCYDLSHKALIRPVLKVSIRDFGLYPGDKIRLAGRDWTLISMDLILCDTPVGESPFRIDRNAPDSGEYEKSDVKKWLDNWAANNLPINEGKIKVWKKETEERMNKAVAYLLNGTDWTVATEIISENQVNVRLKAYSPLKEEVTATFDFDGTMEGLAIALHDLLWKFSVEGYVESMVEKRGNRTRPSIMSIVKDGEYVKEMYRSLVNHVEEKIRNTKDRPKISYMMYEFDKELILNHNEEFNDMLREGYAPVNGFFQACNLNDVLGGYVCQDQYRSIERILLRTMDGDMDKVDEFLLNLRPNTKEAEFLLSFDDEIYEF